MAGLKKKRKEKSGSPNLVLVIFMIFFILSTITLGVILYMQIQEKVEAKNKAKSAEGVTTEANKTRDYYRMLYSDMRLVIGDKLDKADEEQWNTAREDLMKGGYDKEASKDAALKLMLDTRTMLGSDDFKKKLQKSEDNAAALAGGLKAALDKNKRMEDFSKDHIKRQDTFYQDVSGRIDKSYKDLLAQVKVQTDNFKNTVDHNQKLTQELKDEQEKTLKLKDDHDNEIKKYVRQINIMLAEKKEAAAGGARTGGALTPLILDISMGHPLWDTPVGRVVRVDLDARQVTINLGSAHGVTPELTFNIFGANLAGRAEKAMKGSIEVIKVIDPGTSLCRITSMYDGEGLPIAMHMQAQHRLTRESSFAMREGDLLFNLFWGTRVAVAGYVGITGDASSNPAEQFRQMEDFMYLLKRNGAQVDAYVDLRDGKIQGAITSKTRYLIVGDDLRAPGEKPAPEAPKMPDDDKDKDKDKEKKEEKEMAGKNGQPTLDRNEAVNRSSLQMRKEAVERGLLLISAENFATVVGYRKARSANLSTDIDFRPSLPFAGAPGERGVLVAPDRERPPEEEKKAEPEKKDNN